MFDLFNYSISQRAHDLAMTHLKNSTGNSPSFDSSINKYLELYNHIYSKLEIDAIRNADDDQFKK